MYETKNKVNSMKTSTHNSFKHFMLKPTASLITQEDWLTFILAEIDAMKEVLNTAIKESVSHLNEVFDITLELDTTLSHSKNVDMCLKFTHDTIISVCLERDAVLQKLKAEKSRITSQSAKDLLNEKIEAITLQAALNAAKKDAFVELIENQLAQILNVKQVENVRLKLDELAEHHHNILKALRDEKKALKEVSIHKFKKSTLRKLNTQMHMLNKVYKKRLDLLEAKYKCLLETRVKMHVIAYESKKINGVINEIRNTEEEIETIQKIKLEASSQIENRKRVLLTLIDPFESNTYCSEDKSLAKKKQRLSIHVADKILGQIER